MYHTQRRAGYDVRVVLRRAVPLSFILPLALLLMSAGAQEVWTIQTGAFRDPAEARAHARSLERLGFNVYTETATLGGTPYVRVRAGCFLDRSGAEAVALELQRILGEGDVAPLSPDAPALPCATFEVGFQRPERWKVVSRTEEAVLFQVELGNHRGYVAFEESSGASTGRWRVLQEGERARWGSRDPDARGGTEDLRGQPFRVSAQGDLLRARTLRGDDLVIGAGQLLWQGDRVVVVQVGTMMVAIRIVARPR